MSNLYAMRRANGDWFTLEDDGKLLIPVFHTAHDGFMARLRTVEMLTFAPIALDLPLLNEIADRRIELDFCLVDNPFASLKRGRTLSHGQVMSLITGVGSPRRWKWLARPWSHD